jgi:hypothetical protein
VTLETEASGAKVDVTKEELLAAFGDDERRGVFIILRADDGSYIQAAGQGWRPYTLEFLPTATSRRYERAGGELTKGEVCSAFLDFIERGTSWRTRYTWEEREDPVRKGCLTVAAAVFLLSSCVSVIYLVVHGVSFHAAPDGGCPARLLTVVTGLVEPGVAEAAPGTRYQFERAGYFCVDTDSAPGKPVFNRTIPYRLNWGELLGTPCW